MSTVTHRRRTDAEPLLARLRQMALSAQLDPDAVASLLRDAQNGNGAAFGRLYDLFHNMVYGYAYYYTGNREVAETVTAQTFRLALRRILAACTKSESFGAWLLSIARSEVRARTWGNTANAFRNLTNVGDAEQNRTLEVIQGLALPQREAILLLTILHLDIPDIAVVMGRDAGLVHTLLLASLSTLVRELHE